MRHIVPLFLAVYLLSSCYASRYVYSPSAHNVPVLTQKGDSKIGAYYSTNFKNTGENNDITTKKNKGLGYDIQGAYAVTDKLAIQLSYFRRKEQNYNFSDIDHSSLNYKRKLLKQA